MAVPKSILRRSQFQDLHGKRFGRLVAVRFIGHHEGRRENYWECACDCGKTHIASGATLRKGATKSCGCIRVEATTIHGKSTRPEFSVWKGMLSRCGNPSTNNYANYGGRGISVCDRWRESFAHFLADMGPRPSTNHSIDRINNDGNYEPGNVRWATRIEQSHNSRQIRSITAFGKVWHLRQLAAHYGINETTLASRLRTGMTPEAACIKAVRKLRHSPNPES